MSFDSRGFSDRNSQYFNKPTRTWERWKSDGEAVFEDRNRSGIPRPRRFRHRLLLRSPAGAGAQGSRGEEEGRGGKVARAFNKVLRFFSRATARRRSPGMSNGCRGIACRFTHEANFLAYRDAIFLPFPRRSPPGAPPCCSYFTPTRALPPRIPHPFSLLRAASSLVRM